MAEFLSVNTFYDLEELLSPLYYGDEVKFPPVPPGTPAVPGGIYTKGRIAQDCQWSYSYNGSVIRCFPINPSTNSASNNLVLGRSSQVPSVIHSVGYHFPGSIIKCDAELKIHNRKGLRKLLLGLDCGASGALVIFDPIKGRPLKWINLPAPATAVTVLSHFERDGCTRPFLSESVMAMVGVAAVGLVGGQFLIVDLGLDDKEKSTSGGYTYLDQSGDNYFNLFCVEPHEEFIVSKRRTAISQKLMICLEFNYQPQPAEEDNLFYYLDHFGNELGTLRKAEVQISCIEYIPAIESIVIGYNFGGFQIWKLDKFHLEYSSPFNGEGLPVFSFLFQQPIDDPKNYCYLWVIYGISSAEVSPARVELNALVYAEHDPADPDTTGPVYNDLRSCVRRLSFHLQDCYSESEPDPDDSIASDEVPPMRFLVRPLRMWSQAECLLFIAWESCREGVSYLGIFDLNQWYSAQTPDSFLMSGENRLNPFWCAISFGNPGLCSQIWDTRIIPRTLEKWINPHVTDDIHLFPASITFQAVCLSSTGVYTFEHFGIQEKLLRLIQKDGYSMMAEPGRLRELCQSVGLSKYYSPAYEEEFTEAELDQIFVLTVLLESRRPSLIVQFASKWFDGSYENLGCGLDLIMKWILSFAATIRSAANPHWLMMLSHRLDELPPETFHFIHYSNFVWTQLKSLLWTILRPLSTTELEEYSDINFALDKLVQYSATLLMLHRAGILPVSPTFLFMNTLKIYYDERRASVRNAFDQCPYLQPDERSAHPLMVDYLFENLDEEFLREEWEIGPGEPFYPPRDPGLIMNLFLGSWVHIPSKIISRIIFYFMLDLMQCPENRIDLRGDFSSIISLTPEEQGHVEVLWMLDHCEYSEAISQLPKITIDDEKDGLPWSAAVVILAAQGFHRPISNILRGGVFPAKIAKFAFRLLCDLEPDRKDVLGGIISRFATNESLVYRLLEIAESGHILESLLNSSLSQCSEPVQFAIQTFFKGLPPTFENRVRLLNFLIRKDKFGDAVEHYKVMIQQFRDRKMLSARELLAWETAEVNLKKLMISSFGTCSADGVAGSTQVKTSQIKSITVQTRQMPTTPEPAFVSHGLHAVPPHIRRLMKDGMETRPGQTVFSPLRRYSGRLHKEPTPNPVVVKTPDKGRRSISGAYAATTPESGTRKTSRLSVDFHSLLQSPRVTHGRLSEEEFESPASRVVGQYVSVVAKPSFTPESGARKTNRLSVHFHPLLKSQRVTHDGRLSDGELESPADRIVDQDVSVVVEPSATPENDEEMESPANRIVNIGPSATPESDEELESPANRIVDQGASVVVERSATPESGEEMEMESPDNRFVDQVASVGVEPSASATPESDEEMESPVNRIVDQDAGVGVEPSATPESDEEMEMESPANIIVQQDVSVVLEPSTKPEADEEMESPADRIVDQDASVVVEPSTTPETDEVMELLVSRIVDQDASVVVEPSTTSEAKEEMELPANRILDQDVSVVVEPSDTPENDEEMESTANRIVDQDVSVAIEPSLNESQDEFFEATVELPIKPQRLSSSKSLRSMSPSVPEVTAPVRSRSMPRSLDPTNVLNESLLTTPPRFRRSTRSMSRGLEDDSFVDESFNRSSDASLLDISLDLPKKRASRSKKSPSPSPLIPAPSTSAVGTRTRTRASISLNESVLATPSPRRRNKRSRSLQPDEDDGDVSLIDESLNKGRDDSVFESSKEALKRLPPRAKKPVTSKKDRAASEPRSSSGSWRLLEQNDRETESPLDNSFLDMSVEEPKPKKRCRTPTRSGSEPKSVSPTPTTSSKRNESFVDESFNQSSDTSLLDISLDVDVPKKRGSRSKKSPSPSPLIPASSTSAVGTRTRTRTSISLNESVLATPSPRRRSTRSRSRQPDEDDGETSLIDDSLNKGRDDSVFESSMEAPKHLPPRARKSVTSKKGRASSEEPRSSTGSWSIFDQGIPSHSPESDFHNIKPLTRSVTRLLERSDGATETPSDNSILDVSVEEPKPKKRCPTRTRSKSEPKSVPPTPTRSSKRKRVSSGSKPEDQKSGSGTLMQRRLRNFFNYEHNLSTVNEESLEDPSP